MKAPILLFACRLKPNQVKENQILLEKLIGFAKEGKGRRMLNTLNKKDTFLSASDLDLVLKMYCEVGLPIELASLKKRKGILKDSQYDALADSVIEQCSTQTYADFASALRKLLSSGMTMNPTKMDLNELK